MNNLTDEMKIACCKSCLLAYAMRDCTSCPFQVGLLFGLLDKVKTVEMEYPGELRESRLESLLRLV